MPVYNGEDFLALAVTSILNQTYQDFELLIADDASTDRTWTIIQDFKKRFPNKIRTYKLSKNGGAFPATNFLASKAKGKYLALMDSDDISFRLRLERQVDYLNNHPNVILVGTQADIIDERGSLIGKKNLPLTHQGIYYQFAVVNPIINPSVMIRRSLLPTRNFLYRTGFGVNSDYQTFFEWLNYGEFANLEETLIRYRRHLNNSSFRNLKIHFTNTLKIRLEACRQYNYNLSLTQLLLILIQIPVVYLLPNKILSTVYTVLRDLDNPKNSWLAAVAKIRKSLFDPISGMSTSRESTQLTSHQAPSSNLNPAFQV